MKKYYYLVLLISVISCIDISNNKLNKTENISLSRNQIEITSLDISDFTEKTHLIKLQEAEEGLIGRIKDMDLSDDFIFILAENGIFRFDNSGNFLNQISKKGKGPGEYQQSSSFSLDNEKNIIYILTRNKIMKYTFDNKLLAEKKSPRGMNNISYNRDKLLCTHSILNSRYLRDSGVYSIVILSDELEIEDKLLPLKKDSDISPMFIHKANLYHYSGKFHYNNPFNDTLYYLHNSKLEAKYVFVSERDKEDYHINRVVEANDFIIVRTVSQNEWDLFFYDKKKKKIRQIKTDKVSHARFSDNKNRLPDFTPNFYKGENWMADFIYGYQIDTSPALKDFDIDKESLILRIVRF